jgi:ERCC4-type nuclease
MICGASFVARTATRKYCGARCRQIFQTRSNRVASAIANKLARAQNPEKFRRRDNERRAENLDKYREMARARNAKIKMIEPERYREMLRKQSESERRRNAARALSTLLMPTHQHPAE